jgi:hypothetical protein
MTPTGVLEKDDHPRVAHNFLLYHFYHCCMVTFAVVIASGPRRQEKNSSVKRLLFSSPQHAPFAETRALSRPSQFPP